MAGFILGMLLVACTPPSDAQRIIDAAIETHGGSQFENIYLSFDFRNRHYSYQRQGGQFRYTREFADSSGQVIDILSNAGFSRLLNGDTLWLPDERKNAFTNSVNSVLYFAVLPYGLNDAAARKTYVKETSLKGESYHQIRVHFEQEGGGEDFEDEFLYWIHTQNYTMDYLAYRYHTDGGGLRFREAVNPRKLGGIRLQDYLNYKPLSPEASLDSLGALFARGELELLSEIKLINPRVTALR
jgi:hypothetical protein